MILLMIVLHNSSKLNQRQLPGLERYTSFTECNENSMTQKVMNATQDLKNAQKQTHSIVIYNKVQINAWKALQNVSDEEMMKRKLTIDFFRACI